MASSSETRTSEVAYAENGERNRKVRRIAKKRGHEVRQLLGGAKETGFLFETVWYQACTRVTVCMRNSSLIGSFFATFSHRAQQIHGLHGECGTNCIRKRGAMGNLREERRSYFGVYGG